VGELVSDPLFRIRLCVEWLLLVRASVADLTRFAFNSDAKMMAAKIQTTALVTSVRLSAADMSQTPMNVCIAIWMIALARHAVANVAIPIAVEAY
jgi:hypothetical protein